MKIPVYFAGRLKRINSGENFDLDPDNFNFIYSVTKSIEAQGMKVEGLFTDITLQTPFNRFDRVLKPLNIFPKLQK